MASKAQFKLLSLRELSHQRPVEVPSLPTGMADVDQLIDGFPRGAISEIVGEAGSGGTSLLMKLFAAATARMEICAYIDANGAFDPSSAAATGVTLSQLVWVRCDGNINAALRSADHLLQAGGFGVVALDLAGISLRVLHRIPSSFWYRYRGVIEHTSTILVILGREIVTRNCASLQLRVRPAKRLWVCRGGGSGLFRGLSFELLPVKPMRQGSVMLVATPRLF
ncbi:MAG: hypothetical protein ABI882_04255 [Acidobacteriota bacterium]